MNPWLIAAAVLLLGLVPCGIVCLRGTTMERLVALELASTIAVLELLLLAVGFGRPSFIDLALTLALLTFPAGFVFAHFLEGER